MFKFFDSTKNYMMEEQWIIKETCSKQSDPNECAMLVKNYWPTVAHRLFTIQMPKWCVEAQILNAHHTSGQLGFFTHLHTWNCDKCKADVGAVSTLLVSDDATNAAVDMLQGKAFCQDPGMGFSGKDIKFAKCILENTFLLS